MHPTLTWLWVLAVVIFAAAVISIVRRLNARKNADREEERRKVLEEEIAAGKRMPSGKLACIICQRAEATHALPRIGQSAFEQLNPLRTLYGAPKLYRREHDPDGERVICRHHHDVACSILDRFMAEMRRASAEFALEQDRRVGRMRSGKLVLAIRQEERSAQAEIAKESGAPLALIQGDAEPAPEDEDVAVVSVGTTNGRTAEV